MKTRLDDQVAIRFNDGMQRRVVPFWIPDYLLADRNAGDTAGFEPFLQARFRIEQRRIFEIAPRRGFSAVFHTAVNTHERMDFAIRKFAINSALTSAI